MTLEDIIKGLLELPGTVTSKILSQLAFEEVAFLMTTSPALRSTIIYSRDILQSIDIWWYPRFPQLMYHPSIAAEAINLYRFCADAGNWWIQYRRYMQGLWNEDRLNTHPSSETLLKIEALGLQGFDYGLYTAAVVYLKEYGDIHEERGVSLMRRLRDKSLPAHQICWFRGHLREQESERFMCPRTDRPLSEHKCHDHPSWDPECDRCFAKLEVRKYLSCPRVLLTK